MDINKILNEYDLMFGKNNLKEIEDFLVSYIYTAKQSGREDVRITLLNELIGFCRDTTQKDKALHYCDELRSLMDYYDRGMKEIEKHVGKTDNYYRVFEKYEMVKSKCSISKKINNIERCRVFYEKYGKKMILEKFPDYYKKIAVGLVGEGSDCFGFEDDISKDHDFGIGFCMWLTEDDFRAIGEQLQIAYEELVLSAASIKKEEKTSVEVNKFISNRRGVFSINGFYNGLLDTSLNYENEFNLDYMKVEEFSLSVATNGQVFWDDLGVFTKVRDSLLKYYPDNIWRGKVAQCIHDFSQYAQSNYPRMMARKDYATSILCIGKAVETAMDLVYLLNKKYAPYYKWKKRGIIELEKLSDIDGLLEELALLSLQDKAWDEYSYSPQVLNVNDRCVVIFEEMAKLFVNELNKQGLIIGEDTFLEVYINQIVKGIKMDIIDKIIEIEWRQFDKVKNEGGRADCQNDFNTFSIMRKSQYLAWSEELLESYLMDLTVAENKGWNMVMEKYARMMESTCPKRYSELKKDIPQLTEDRIAIQEEVIKIQVNWMKEFAKAYPKMAGNARSITTSEDNEYNTSYETYLRGEISTYSERTFKIYGGYVVSLFKENKNFAYMIMENTAKLYGYTSLEDAEKRL